MKNVQEKDIYEIVGLFPLCDIMAYKLDKADRILKHALKGNRTKQELVQSMHEANELIGEVRRSLTYGKCK